MKAGVPDTPPSSQPTPEASGGGGGGNEESADVSKLRWFPQNIKLNICSASRSVSGCCLAESPKSDSL